MTTRQSTPPLAQTAAPSRLAGAASEAGTKRYATRFASRFVPTFFAPFVDGLTLSSLGLGTYLGDCTDEEDTRYTECAVAALESGVNVLDTAINYRCQRSERALGRALRAAVAKGVVRRDEVVLCSKGGYVPLDGAPPASREEYQEYLAREFYEPGVMTPADLVAGGHCLTPGFLAHQLECSRANLGVETLDVYYLHNPEQQLATLSPEQFRARLRAAFTLLEERVERGEIARYGIATWQGLRVPHEVRGHLALADLVAVAREVAGDAHHFRAVQLPINLAMHEAVRLPTQALPSGKLVPALEAAVEMGLTVVSSATLLQAQLARGLPQPAREAFPRLDTDAQCAIAFVTALPGVATALVGMRRREHLEENLRVGAAAQP